MPTTNTPILAEQLAGQIAEHVQTQQLERGVRLTERHLAALLNVSRSPVRGALKLLAKRGLVRRDSDGSYFTARKLGRVKLLNKPIISQEETLYLRIAEDRLSGRIPEKVSENSLMRRYKTGRGEVVRILWRAADEGWAERLAGHGWSFLPVLTSPEVYQQSYRFRMLIEPQGILEPTFQLDRAALLRSREEQQLMLDGNGLRLSPAALFVIGSRFHKTLIRCSGNTFLIDALERINRLGRLIDIESWSTGPAGSSDVANTSNSSTFYWKVIARQRRSFCATILNLGPRPKSKADSSRRITLGLL